MNLRESKNNARLGLIWCGLLLAMLFIFGCAGFRFGSTEAHARAKYLLVDPQTKSFGYERLQREEGFRSPIKGFVEHHGFPDFIYEYTERNRRGIELYYVQKNQVYDFVETSWMPDSVYPRSVRGLYKVEHDLYHTLVADQNAHRRNVPPPVAPPESRSYENKLCEALLSSWRSAFTNYFRDARGKFVILTAFNPRGEIEDQALTFCYSRNDFATSALQVFRATQFPGMSEAEIACLGATNRFYLRMNMVFPNP